MVKAFDDKVRAYPEKFQVDIHPTRQEMLSIDEDIRNKRMDMENTAGNKLDNLYIAVKSTCFH